jgi:sarcosine oxidase, subunit gamma
MASVTALPRRSSGREHPAEKRVSVRVAAPAAKVRVQSWVEAPKGIESILGASLPSVVGLVGGERVRALCIGPSDWLLVSSVLDARSLVAELRGDKRELCFSVADMSLGLTTVEVGGRWARELLSKGCGLDLHPRVFGPGQCARTRFAQMAVVIECVDTASTFMCYVPCSYTDYFIAWVGDAAAEFEGVAS